MAGEQGRNLTAKILAVILAIILWLYVMNEQNPPIEATFTVPLEVRNVAGGLVVEDAPDTVRIKVRGPRSIIAGVMTKDLKSYIDLRGLGEGQHNVRVAAAIPSSLNLVEVSPDKVTVRLDTSISRQVPVEVRLTGTAAAGVVVGKVTARPEQITIEGPKSAVNAVERVVAIVDLSGRQADFTVDVPLKLFSQNGKEVQGLTVYSDKVTVTATLVKGPSKKTVDVKPIIYGELASGVQLTRITTEPAKVEITGDSREIEKIDFIYTEPVNLAGINRETTREAKLQLKEGIVASQGAVTVHIIVGTRQ
ncbi:CdaR family protein [Sporolituus thermophilus]|uniref:YbbR domain-containing protein n=1 Tax=Sporolituus thermophilus DSM 23256 TaxID=1123285 RepID=A0A1G7LQ10_9FIRM|nr:CdaR family protein [Sporolituus thermophilus]SDF51618.1 YbbR domain-containing protein [Sporolituus thermophilus DSM 23256]